MLSHSVMPDSVTPWTVAHQAPQAWNFLGKNVGARLPFPSPEALPNIGIEPTSLTSPALTGGFFTTAPLYVTFGQK